MIRNFQFDSNVLPIIYKINSTFLRNNIEKSIDEQFWQYSGIFKNDGYLTFVHENNNNYYSSIYIVTKRYMKFQGNNIIAAQSLDTLTDFNSRGKGYFVRCAECNYQFIDNENINFVFGFPNKNSFTGFISKLGWNSLDPVPFLFLPLNITYFLKKFSLFNFIKLPNFYLFHRHKFDTDVLINQINFFTSEYDSLWKKFSNNINISVIRDPRYLNWRFINNPTEKYLIYSATYNNTIAGFIVINIKNKHGGKIGYVMELIFDPLYPNVATSLLSYVIRKFKSESVDAVLAWCFEHSISYSSFKQSGFFKLPLFLRKIELHFGYRIIKSNEMLSKILSNPKSWYISYSDSDTN